MNDLSLITNEVKTMSSREIAEITGKEHKNVIRDIKAMLSELNGHDPHLDHLLQEERDGSEVSHLCINGVSVDKDSRGYIGSFHLPKRECYILMAGYRVDIRAKIIDRWEQLEQEKKASIPDFYNPRAACLAWLEQHDKIEEQRLLIAKQAPAVEFVENYMEANGTYNLRATAKALKCPERVFLQWAKERSILFKMSDVWYPSSEHLKNGNFIVRVFERNGQAGKQTMVTPKGFSWLAKMLEKDKQDGKLVIAKK